VLGRGLGWLKELLADWLSCETRPEDALTYTLKCVRRVVYAMLRQIDLIAVKPIDHVVPRVASHINMLAAEYLPHLIVFVSLSQQISLVTLIILEVKYVESGSLVGTAGSSFLLDSLHLLGFPLALFIHELPPFEVSIVLFNPINHEKHE
jgi:hypothetical protein